MIVKEVMQEGVMVSKPDTTIKEAARVMSGYGIGSLVVVNEKENIIGIITERDIMKKVVAEGKDPREVEAQEIMTKKL